MKTKALFSIFCQLGILFLLSSCQNNLILDGSVFVGEIDDHPYAVFLEAMEVDDVDVSSFSGHFLDLSESRADSIPFVLTVNKKTVRIEVDKEAVKASRKNGTLDDRSLSMLNRNLRLFSFDYDGDEMDGKVGMGFFMQKIPFYFETYYSKPFVQYPNHRYRKPSFKVKVEKDIPFAHVTGYWDHIPHGEDKGFDLLRKLRETGETQGLELTMDVYTPEHDALEKRPLVMMIHGGAFYLGTKDSPNYVKWCEHLASTGYVVASINYRLGFKPNLAAIERSGYRALQDAHAAMRYLVEEQNTYRIDTSMIFVGGSSAGAITSLNLAYMTDEYRPATSYADESKGLEDLGTVAGSGNKLKQDFDIKGVVNMWGAVSTLDMLDHNNVPILSFHGDRDDIVPYKYDYPFKAVGSLKKYLFNKMYGSYDIQQRAEQNNIPAYLHTFKGLKHEPQVDKNDSINENFFLIQDMMDEFFCGIVAPVKPRILVSEDEPGAYYLNVSNAEGVSWEVEGGLITQDEGNEIKVVWMNNAPRKYVRVSGKLPYDYGFVERRNIK